MNWIDLTAVLSLFVYAVASVAALAGLLARDPRVKKLAFGLTLTGFLLHTSLLFAGQISPDWRLSTRSAYLPPVAWCLVAVGLGMWWKLRIDALLLFSPPLAFLLLFIALVVNSPSTALPHTLTGPLFFAHLFGVSAGIGLMAVAAGAAVVFLLQEHSIKRKKTGTGLRRDLPAQSTLDRINALATAIGFPAYSLGVLCGFVWARMVWNHLLSGDPKEWISLIIWTAYAVLFHQRLALGWRGRKPAIMALGIFGASLFSLLVVNTMLPTHHSFEARL